MSKTFLIAVLAAAASILVLHSAEEQPLHPNWRGYSSAKLKQVVSKLGTFREATKAFGEPESTTRSPMDGRLVTYRMSETTILLLEGAPLNDLDPKDDLKPIEVVTLYRHTDAGLEQVWQVGDYVFKRRKIPSDRF